MSSESTINWIEVEFRGETPRCVRLTKAGSNLRNLSIGLSASMILLWGCLTVASLSKLIRLKNSGKVATALVTRKYVVHSKYDNHYVDFSFNPPDASSPGTLLNPPPGISPIQSSPEMNRGGFPDSTPPNALGGGKEFKGETIVDHLEYDSMQIGHGITITYLPSDPSVNQFGVVDEKMIQSKFVFLGSLGLVVFGVFDSLLGFVLWMTTSQMRLLVSGVATPAFIQSCTPILPSLKDSAVKVIYKYSAPGFGEYTGSVIIRPNDVALLMNPNNEAIDAIDPIKYITVLYDPKRLQSSRPYRVMTSMVELS